MVKTHQVERFFDQTTSTMTYVVFDPSTKDAIIIDPILDYHPCSGSVSYDNVERIAAFINGKNLKIHYILETHAHADHLTGAHALKTRYFNTALIGISREITLVQQTFRGIFNFGDKLKLDGSQFDLLLNNKDILKAGSIKISVLATPGHTPACVSYFVDDRSVFTGDALFLPDSGTGRCDFPLGSSSDLFNSVQNVLYALPPETKFYVGHDYQPNDRKIECSSTISVSSKENILLRKETTLDEFTTIRDSRDKHLAAPKLLYPSIQFNIACGSPHAESDGGQIFLRIPLHNFD